VIVTVGIAAFFGTCFLVASWEQHKMNRARRQRLRRAHVREMAEARERARQELGL
jgi:hypothetical protein